MEKKPNQKITKKQNKKSNQKITPTTIGVTPEQNKKYKQGIMIATMLGFIAIIIACIALFFVFNLGYNESAYTIYVGSVDKDAGYPVLTPYEAKEKIAKVFSQQKQGYTLYTAEGGYQNGEVYDRSPSYVLYTSVSTKKELDIIVDMLEEELNTTGIFAHKSPTITYYKDFQ